MAKAMECFAGREDLVFVGGHPMAGSEFRGIDANDPFLYENAIYVVTPMPHTPDMYVNKLIGLVKRVGAIPLIMEPSKHDRVAAGISHLPQMMASGLVDMISKEENSTLSKTLCAGGFRDMTRIASSHYRMWKDIIYTNKDNIFDMIDNYIVELQQVKAAIEEGSLEDIFENARITRDAIPKGTRGIIQPNFEIMVRIPDEPGMLLKISTILAEENINIKDINIQRNRENEGGQFRLGFDTMSDCESAVKHLQFKGFYSRIIE
jgi:prephenate dehydrogenase